MHPLLRELTRDNDPHDALDIAPDVVLAARADREFSTLAPGSLRRPFEPQIHLASNTPAGASAPSPEATFRVAADDHVPVPGLRSSKRKWATRALLAFLFALGSGAAAEGWRHYNGPAKQLIANWTPWTVATSSPQANPAPTEQQTSPDVQAAAAAPAAPAQPATSAQPATAAPATETVATSAAPPDEAQLMQSMAQQIEQLKASVEQLKAGQEQMARDIAKGSEAKASEAKASVADVRTPDPNLRPRIAAPRLPPAPPRAVAAQRKPKPTFTAVQPAPPAPLPAVAPPAPLPVEPEAQTAVETDGNPVVRPPMPVR
jgi:hypothetical protein